MSFDLTVLLLGAVIAVLALRLGLAWVGIRRVRLAEALSRELRADMETLRRETSELQPYALQLGERLGAIERRMSHLSDRQAQVESQARSGPDYDSAIRMAKAGATPEELSRQCGLGQSEAKLVVAIHGERP